MIHVYMIHSVHRLLRKCWIMWEDKKFTPSQMDFQVITKSRLLRKITIRPHFQQNGDPTSTQ
jgi:hypothetical protein